MKQEALIDENTIHVYEWITEKILDFMKDEWKDGGYTYLLGGIGDQEMIVRWTENKSSNLIEWRFIGQDFESGVAPIDELEERLEYSSLHSEFKLNGKVLEQRIYVLEEEA